MRMPPFAKHLDSGACEVWVYVGSDAWTSARFRDARGLPVLLLPPDQDPEQFRWPVDGKEVMLIQQGQHDISKIPSFANLLFTYGATAVFCIYGEVLVKVVYYKRGSDDNAD